MKNITGLKEKKKMKTQTNYKMVWKRRDGWLQYDPPKSHPSYEEWMKLREKEKQNG